VTVAAHRRVHRLDRADALGGPAVRDRGPAHRRRTGTAPASGRP
jgi:hypothetical protein